MIQIVDLHLKKRIPEISSLDLQIEAGECYVLLSSGETAVNHLINIFSGLERNFKGGVKIDGRDIRGNWNLGREKAVCLSCDREWPPDMRVRNLIAFSRERAEISAEELEEILIKFNLENHADKRLHELEEVDWRNILFALVQLKGCKNYIIRDFARGMPLDFNLEFKKHIQQMKQNGFSILYLSDDVFFAPEIGDRVGFLRKGKLLLELKAARMKKMSLRELYFQFLAEK